MPPADQRSGIYRLSRLPQISGDRVRRALERADFFVARQKGSHALMRHKSDPSRRCTVPIHKGHRVKPGTLMAILRGAKLELQDFLKLI
ncbi:MAG: hypothetical protein CO113_03460 [Elusimicrobia bacterium CG_4_9_14_3_um_filter_62_55]|nr:MAG: hypothetical protein COR54_19590 [Elusimicrobia bacterium CG22_combo_CG10-13_8_21_14_all_63_91]PJA14000.1 MAG: hypothetical protein COX66_13730 [Elusimicrobia bacterium CG_4_10_14_0_2_um_filter_63_34]PJB26457.1 MAG: hypothetical protein CO113_03460 [Elusimicrobia bacterium CG_4_9_14_3_um_filter_62_55]